MKITSKLINFVILFILLTAAVSAQSVNDLSWAGTSSQYTQIYEGESAVVDFLSFSVLQSDYPIYVTLDISGSNGYENYLTHNFIILNEAEFDEAIQGLVDLAYLNLNAAEYELELYSEDDNGFAGPEAHLYLTVTGNGGSVNHAPVANNIEVTTPFETPVQIVLDCVDEDGDDLAYGIFTQPANGYLNGTDDIYTYFPNQNFEGDDLFTYRCHDGTVPSNKANVSITVEDEVITNNAPTFTGIIPDQTINDGEDFEVIYLNNYFDDVDAGDVLTFTADNNDLIVNFNNGVAIITYTQIGSEAVTFTACDLENECVDSNEVTFTVNEVSNLTNNLIFDSDFEPVNIYVLSEYELNLWSNTIYSNSVGAELSPSTLKYSIINSETCDDLLDFTIENGILTIESFENAGDCNFQIYVEETQWLNEQQTATSNVINVDIELNNFNLVELDCEYPVLPMGGTQICYAIFENQNNEPVANATITFDYLNQMTTIGSCTTNENGYCDIAFTVLNQIGEYEVFTSAYAPGYNSYVNMDDTTLFIVMESQYEIIEFNIYNDEANFGNPSLDVTDFFRGEDMYVEFMVINIETNETIIDPNLFSSVTLYSEPASRAFVNFNLIELTTNGFYHFALDAIPLDDDYLGEGLVISYVLNEGEDVAQLERVVQIYNNVPVWENIDSVSMYIGQTATINLNDYIADIEDDVLTLSVIEAPSCIEWDLDNGILLITAISECNSQIIVSALDSDEGCAQTDIGIIIGSIPELNAYFTAPSIVSPGQEFTLDASGSVGNIVEYYWDLGEETGYQHVVGQIITHTYNNRGSYEVTLTVVSEEGYEDSFSRTITVKRLGSCGDGLDNDGDRLIDMDDPGCIESNGFSEFNLNTDLEKGLRFDYVDVYTNGYYVYPGEEVYVNLKLRNKASEDIDDIRITLLSPDLGIKIKSQKFDLNNGGAETVNMILDVPYWTPAGEYALKVSATNGDIIHSTYRFFYVGN